MKKKIIILLAVIFFSLWGVGLYYYQTPQFQTYLLDREYSSIRCGEAGNGLASQICDEYRYRLKQVNQKKED